MLGTVGDVYKVGGKLTLAPADSFPDPIQNIVWKHNGNKVADWDPAFSNNTDLYGDFDGRTTLDTGTGQVVIDDLLTSLSGVYSVELNGKPQKTTFAIAVIVALPMANSLELYDVTYRSMRARWNGAKGASGYRILYAPLAGEGAELERTVMVAETELVLEGLIPQTEYRVSVFAMYGEEASEPITSQQTTQGSNPGSAGVSVLVVLVVGVLLAVVIHRYMSGD